MEFENLLTLIKTVSDKEVREALDTTVDYIVERVY